MLKKVGIVATGATAALIALSPLAFATNGHDGGDTSGDPNTVVVEDNSVDRNQVNRCTFNNDDSDGGLVPGVGTVQIQALNCVNVGDGSTFAPAPVGGIIP